MDELAKILGLYNIVGYFLPGLVVVFTALFISDAFRRRGERKLLSKENATLIIVAAFITGHLLQAVASGFDDKLYRGCGKDSIEAVYGKPYERQFKEQLTELETKTFPKTHDFDAFKLCETYGRTHQLDSYTEQYLANRALFRGLTIALAFAFLASILLLIYKPKTNKLMLLSFLLAASAFISFERFEKFNEYWTDSVYRTFYMDQLRPIKKDAPGKVE